MELRDKKRIRKKEKKIKKDMLRMQKILNDIAVHKEGEEEGSDEEMEEFMYQQQQQ